MCTNKINVLMVQPNKLPKSIEIYNNLDEYQKLVHGKIEICYLQNDKEVCIICNQDGKVNKMPVNRDIGCDILYGDFLIVGDDYVNGDFRSLSIKQIEKYTEIFNNESIITTKRKLAARKLVQALMYRK